MKKLEGKVAIITGASRGVGEYKAIEVAKEGWNAVRPARHGPRPLGERVVVKDGARTGDAEHETDDRDE